MTISVLIFDLDGTLIDSSVDIRNAINYAVEPYGLKPVSVTETISLIGEGVTRLFDKLGEREGVVFERDKVIGRFMEHYEAHIIDNTPVYPGVRETLDQLGRYRKAVISNKREVLCRKALEMLRMEKYFQLIIGSDTVPERKPSPMPLLHAVGRLGASPKDAAIIGDSTFDIDAGKAAGMKTIAVTYGYRPAAFLKGADFLIAEMPELLPLLGVL